MEETNPTAETQADPAVEPQAGTQTTETQEQATPDPAAQAEAEKEASEAKKARAEAANYRKQLRDAEARLKAIDEANLSEADKQAKRLAELETQVKQRDADLLQARVEVQATKLGIVDPEAAAQLLRLEDGQSVEDGLKALLKAKPWLKGPATPAAPAAPTISPTNPGRGQSAPTRFSTEQISDPAFYTANRDAILQAMREGRITS